MEITMNGKTVQYNMDFRKQYPDVFKILDDSEHEIFYIENVEENDLIVFLSPEHKLLTTIEMSEFEKYLRKLNKKLFFNILSLFTDSFESETDIRTCEIVSKDIFLEGFTTNYRFLKTNIIFKKDVCEFYISPSREVGTVYDIEAVRRKNAFVAKINSLNSKQNGKIFYNVPSKKLMTIDYFTGDITPVGFDLTDEELEYLDDFPRVTEPWNEKYFCDAREFLKICKNKEMPISDCNFYVENKTLHVCFVKNHERFKTLADVAKYLYNNQDTHVFDKIKERLNSQDFFYLFNGERNDCIIYRSGKELKAITLKELDINESYSDIMSIFPKEDIVNIEQLNVPYLLFLKLGRLQDMPSRAIETKNYFIWADFFSKTLYAARKG